MNQEIRNEAELRFCIGDPILCGICDTWKYKAELEESVKSQTTTSSQSSAASPSTSGTPRGSKLHKSVTDQSKADYTVYVVRDNNGSTVSVIIEAKHTSHSGFNHVKAQIVGYFAAFEVESELPLVFILTELYVEMVFFPFITTSDAHALINAVVLPPFDLFEESGDVNLSTLQLLLSLSKACSYASEEFVKLPEGCPNMSRTVFSRHIETETMRIEELQKKLDDKERINLAQKEQILKLQSRLEQYGLLEGTESSEI